ATRRTRCSRSRTRRALPGSGPRGARCASGPGTRPGCPRRSLRPRRAARSWRRGPPRRRECTVATAGGCLGGGSSAPPRAPMRGHPRTNVRSTPWAADPGIVTMDGMTEVRVLVVDDQDAYRRAMAAVVAETSGFVVVGAVATGEESVDAARDLAP